MMEKPTHSMTENIESLMKRLVPTSDAELRKWIQTFPEELGMRLLEEHWRLSLPKEPGRFGVGDWWGRMQKRVPREFAMRGTIEENKKYLEAKRLQREENLRKYLEELDARETTAE